MPAGGTYALKFIGNLPHETHEKIVTSSSWYVRTQIHTCAKWNCLAMSRLCSKFLESDVVLNFSN
jgi:hypothetical protein